VVEVFATRLVFRGVHVEAVACHGAGELDNEVGNAVAIDVAIE
jgi:hypothetical protein